jgi:CBS domain-containing protein
MKASDVMTRQVTSVHPDDTVAHAVRLMLQKRVSGLPVVDSVGRLVGIVTEGDFLRRSEIGTQRKRPRWLEFLTGHGKLAEEYARSHGRKIHEVMTEEPVSVTEDTTLEDIVALMEKHRIKRVPVVRGDQLIGIISRANLLHALARVSKEAAPAPKGDAEIRATLLAEIANQRWAPLGAIEVIVRNGTVDLWGTITDDRERQALVVAAENTPGVKAVKDHIAWVDPTSAMVFLPQDDIDAPSQAH